MNSKRISFSYNVKSHKCLGQGHRYKTHQQDSPNAAEPLDSVPLALATPGKEPKVPRISATERVGHGKELGFQDRGC